ncbi:MAG: transporter substrate-binding domain-containing protein [Oligoflexia bacterium]|nr:transporter substrate-binding domain-containing protein [Oligoflexia bacterium]
MSKLQDMFGLDHNVLGALARLLFSLTAYLMMAQGQVYGVNNAVVEIYTEEYPPYSYTENGKPAGLATEVVVAVFKEAGLVSNIRFMPWARAYSATLKNKDTFIYSIARTVEREDLFVWVDEIISWDMYVYKHRDKKNINLTKLDDAKKYKIGVVRQDARSQYLLN